MMAALLTSQLSVIDTRVGRPDRPKIGRSVRSGRKLTPLAVMALCNRTNRLRGNGGLSPYPVGGQPSPWMRRAQ